jgi:hypothetical protein
MFKRFTGLFRRGDAGPDIAELQDSAVKSVAADIVDLQEGEWEDREWVYIAVNHEILIEEGRRSSTQASVLARKPGGELEDLDFRLSTASKAKLLALRETMTKDGEDAWTILDLTIKRDGRYDFQFSYAPPPRLNGDLLHSPLSNLLEQYLAKGKKR